MNPHKKNKVDVSSLSPEEQRLFRLYGKLPSRSDHFAKHLKERKYFDSGDYALQKAGKSDSVDAGEVGVEHPVPEKIPHLSSPVSNQHAGAAGGPAAHHHNSSSFSGGAPPPGLLQPQQPTGLQAGSPVKESSFLNCETNAEDVEQDEGPDNGAVNEIGGLPAEGQQSSEGIPIRR